MSVGRVARRAGAGLLAVLLLVPAAGSATAAAVWSISATPNVLDAGRATTVSLTVANLGGAKDASLGCIQVSLPGSFDVLATSVASMPSIGSWKSGTSGGSGSTRIAEYRADSDADALEPSQLGVFTVRVVGRSAGSFTWTARAWSDRSCGGTAFPAIQLAVTVTGPVATTAPTPTPTPTPSPTPTPRPSPTPTPTPTPVPIDVRPPVTAPSPTPGGSPTPTPTPDSRPTPTPTPRVPEPSGSSSTPTPAPGEVAPATPGPRAPDASGGTAPGTEPDPLDGGAPHLAMGYDPRRPTADMSEMDVSLAAIGGLGMTWAVPSLALAVPGLLLVLAVLAQALGGVVWLPVIRRRIGSFGPVRRRR